MVRLWVVPDQVNAMSAVLFDIGVTDVGGHRRTFVVLNLYKSELLIPLSA